MKTLSASLLAVLAWLGLYVLLIAQTDAQQIGGWFVMCSSALIGYIILKN